MALALALVLVFAGVAPAAWASSGRGALDLAWQAWEAGDPDAATYWAEQAGGDPEGLCLRALEAVRHNSPDLVRYYLDRVPKAGPLTFRAALALGWVQCYLGDPVAAASTFAWARGSRDPWVRAASLEGEAHAWLLAGKANKAWELALQFARTKPQSAGAWVLLGDVALALRKAELAADMYRQALMLSPGHPRSMAGLGDAMLLSGNPRQAAACYEAVLSQGRLDPRSAASALAGTAALLLARGQKEEALEVADVLAKILAPTATPPHLHAGSNGYLPASSLGDAVTRYVLPPSLAEAARYCRQSLSVALNQAEPEDQLFHDRASILRAPLAPSWEILISEVDRVAWGFRGTFR